MEELEFDEYNKLFSYDADQGLLTNRVRRSSRALAGASALSSGRSAKPLVKHQGASIEAARICWLLSTQTDPGAGGVQCLNGDSSDLRSSNLALVDDIDNEAMKKLSGLLEKGDEVPETTDIPNQPASLGEVVKLRNGRYMARTSDGGGIKIVGYYHSEVAAENALNKAKVQR